MMVDLMDLFLWLIVYPLLVAGIGGLLIEPFRLLHEHQLRVRGRALAIRRRRMDLRAGRA